MAVRQSDIAKKIVSMTAGLHYVIGGLTKDVPPMAAYVEQVDDVPYCCYQVESDAARYCKGGLCGWDSAASLYVVSDGEEEASLIKDAITDAIETYRTGTFFPKITGITPAFDEGQWIYRINYEFITLI